MNEYVAAFVCGHRLSRNFAGLTLALGWNNDCATRGAAGVMRQRFWEMGQSTHAEKVMKPFTLGILLLAGAMLTGCGNQLNTPILTYERDSSKVPPLTSVDHQGLYALFPGDGANELARVYLHHNDKFGFENQDGKVVGVYVDSGQTHTVPLDAILTTEYVWKYQGDKKP